MNRAITNIINRREPRDFNVTSHGSVWTIRAISPEARKWVEENVDIPSWAGSAAHFSGDWRPMEALVERLIEDGWRIR